MISRFSIIDRIRKTSILDKYSEVAGYAQLNKAQLEQEQKKRLSNLLIYLRSKNLFYGRLLQKFTESDIINDPESVLLSLPVADKKFLNENYNEIFTDDTGKSIQRKQTGGSTGTPFKFFINTESISYTWSFIYLFWKKYAEYNFGDPYCSVAGTSFYSRKKKFIYYFYHLLQNTYMIKGDIISSNMEFDRRKLEKAKLVYGYPSSINLLLEYYPDIFSRSKNLKAIFTTSELLIPQVRENIETRSGKKIFDMYGANDGGIASSECHLHNGYHYNMLSCYPESINFYGHDELVVTNLYNFNFPFIRYRVGDLGTIDKTPCKCGLPFDKIINLKGRTRDLLYLKGKKVFHGSAINSLLFKYSEVKLYKVVQQKDYSVDLKILVQPEDRFDEVSQKLLPEFSNLFQGLTFRVTRLSEEESLASDNKFKIIESYVA